MRKLCVFASAILLCASHGIADPGKQFSELSATAQQKIREACEPPPARDRYGPYSTPMYYLMHKGYAYEGNWDADPATRFYDALNGTPGKTWGEWKLDENRPQWQAAMLRNWAELGLNSTHLNIYPKDGSLDIDADWAQAIRDYVELSDQCGLKVGVRLDAIDETKLWTVHPNNPDSQRKKYLSWVEQVATLLEGRTVYYILGDELTLRKPAPDLPEAAWTAPMYLDYFKEASTAIKRGDPGAKVCMFAASSGEWFNVVWLLENGYAAIGDGVAINHYDYQSVPAFVADRDRLAPGKLFLTSGVGYVSNGAVAERYPEGDGYAPAASEDDHAAFVAKTMFSWWDLGADVAPYYLSLRNWTVNGKHYPRWFGFLGFEDFVIEREQLSVKRYPAWFAYQAVAQTFYNREQLRTPEFKVTSSKPLSKLRAFERDIEGGTELLLMIWNDDEEAETTIQIGSDKYRYPVQVSLTDFREWNSLLSDVDDRTTTLPISVGPEPQILRLVNLRQAP